MLNLFLPAKRVGEQAGFTKYLAFLRTGDRYRRKPLVAEELNNTHIKLALFRLLFANKWVTYLDKLPIYWLD